MEVNVKKKVESQSEDSAKHSLPCWGIFYYVLKTLWLWITCRAWQNPHQEIFRFQGRLAASSHKIWEIKDYFKSHIMSIWMHVYLKGGCDLTWSEEFSFHLAFIYIHPSAEIFSEVSLSCILNRTSNQLERNCLSVGAIILFPLQLKMYIQIQLVTENCVKSHAGTSIRSFFCV